MMWIQFIPPDERDDMLRGEGNGIDGHEGWSYMAQACLFETAPEAPC